VAPVNLVLMSSDLLVRMVSQEAQEKSRDPPMWAKKMRPIFLPVPEFMQHLFKKHSIDPIYGTLTSLSVAFKF